MNMIYRSYRHENLSIMSLLKFSVSYVVLLPISMGALWVLVDVLGMHYMLGALISGAISLIGRYLLSAVVVFNGKRP